jgi:hypothetical protein
MHQCADSPTLYPYPARRLVWFPLHASSDHSFTVGALRAQRLCQLSRHSLSKLARFSLRGLPGRFSTAPVEKYKCSLQAHLSLCKRVACLISQCVRRTRAFYSSLLPHLREEGRWSLPARIERPQLYRGGSASRKDRLTTPFSTPSSSISLHEGGLVDPHMRTSNDINDPSKLVRYLSGMGAD